MRTERERERPQVVEYNEMLAVIVMTVEIRITQSQRQLVYTSRRHVCYLITVQTRRLVYLALPAPL